MYEKPLISLWGQVTAAHCVYDINDSHQYVASLNFAPGEASENALPYGSVQWASVRVLSQFTNQASGRRADCMCLCTVPLGICSTPLVYMPKHA